jgi:cell division septation protein DedD
MMGDGTIRDLEQLQEEDTERKTPRAVTAAFVMLGGACIVFAALALSGRRTKVDAPKTDPLGDLVAAHGSGKPAASKPEGLSARDVTFPNILSDGNSPTTALAAVRPGTSIDPSAAGGLEPPPPTDKLPVVPLPAQNVLEATPVVTRPRDALTRAASDQAQIDAPQAPAAPAGHEGGYQLQVSSFRTQGEASHFADQLRARSHQAYVVEAHVPGRGTWYRVRIGPFSTQIQASNYRATFEAKEHVVPFIVPPQGQ